VQEILDNLEFRNQIPRLSKADGLGTLIEKFTFPGVDLSPSGLDNHGIAIRPVWIVAWIAAVFVAI